MSRGIYGQARVGEVSDAGVSMLGSRVATGGFLVMIGLLGAAAIKHLSKLKLAGRVHH
jgi:hypothetical protein